MTKKSNRIWYIIGCIALTLAIAFVGSYAVTLYRETHGVDTGTDAPATDNGADDGASDGEHIDGETVCLHEFDLVEETPATCNAEGYEKYECLHCKSIEERTTKKLSHDYETTIIQPTCTKLGYTLKACRHCGLTRKFNYKEPLGHVYDSEVIAEPTHTEAGMTVHTCLECGDIYEETTFPLGHQYTVSEGADAETGILYIYYTCTECGHVETLTEACEHGDGNNDNVCDYCGMRNDRQKRDIIEGE